MDTPLKELMENEEIVATLGAQMHFEQIPSHMREESIRGIMEKYAEGVDDEMLNQLDAALATLTGSPMRPGASCWGWRPSVRQSAASPPGAGEAGPIAGFPELKQNDFSRDHIHSQFWQAAF